MTDAVVFACDANYAPYAYFAGRQIAMAHPDRSFDICVFSMDALTPPPAIAQLGIECRRIPGANPFEDAVHQTRHTAATYLRRVRSKLRALGHDVDTKLALRDAATSLRLLD